MTAQEARDISNSKTNIKIDEENIDMQGIYNSIKIAAIKGHNSIEYRGYPLCSLDINVLTPETKNAIRTLVKNGFKAKLHSRCGIFTKHLYILVEW